MQFFISITGMHCVGCKNLIAMCLEDLGYSNIDVNIQTNSATFITQKEFELVKNELNKIFSQELTNYKYSDLKVLK